MISHAKIFAKKNRYVSFNCIAEIFPTLIYIYNVFWAPNLSLILRRRGGFYRKFVRRSISQENSFDILQNGTEVTPMDLFSLFVLFSHFRPRDILMGVFLLSFHKLCFHLHVHKTNFERNYSLE